MTTIQTGPEVTIPEVTAPGGTVPEVLTEEHHEAIRASWELPAYDRQAPPTTRSTRPLVVGILAGAVGLAVGFGAGYWTHSQMVETAAPIVISRVAGPVDANGLNLGRRLPPLETNLPIGITVPGPVDADGAPLGRRVPPFETQSPNELKVPVAADANGMPLGRRVPAFDAMVPTQAGVSQADAGAFGLHGGRP